MTSSASRGVDAVQDKVLSWADLAEEEEDSSKAYGLRLSYTKWQLPSKDDSSQRKSKPVQSSEGTLSNDAVTSREDEQEINAFSNKGDSLTPSREVLEGLQSLEEGSNLDVTSLLIKKKRRVREAPNKENISVLPISLGLCDFTQTQPPPSVCPPLGFEDVSDPQAIDALVDTLSRVLTRSLCQSNVKNLDIWGEETGEVAESSRLEHTMDVNHSLGSVEHGHSLSSGVGDTQISTHIPSPQVTQTSSQPQSLGSHEQPCSVSDLESTSQQHQQQQPAGHFSDRRHLLADGHGTSSSLQNKYQQNGGGSSEHSQLMARYDGEGPIPQNRAGCVWAASHSPPMIPQNPCESPPNVGFFPRSLSMPLSESHLAPPHFYPVRNPFMTTGYDDQCLVGGFPVSEWRRFFVYLATMDTQALLAYLSTQSGAAWCMDRGAGINGSIYTASPIVQTPDPPHQPITYTWDHRASQPSQSTPSPICMNHNPPPPPPTRKASSVNVSAAPSAGVGPQQPQLMNTTSANRAPRRRAQSKPWRRQDIPPPSEGRFKQIARAKATPEYLLYIGHVKKEDRDVANGDPMTPRVEGTTWREFQQDVRAWKRSLHRKAETLQMAT